MTFISLEFLILFSVTAVAVAVCKDMKKRQIILLAASYIFYAYWDIRFLGLLILQTYISYSLAKRIDYTDDIKKRKIYCTVGVTVLLGILGFFKYFNFFIESLQRIFSLKYETLYIILPIGISFYTFQALSYLIDVYRGTTSARKEFYKVSLYISFFPQLVAGPIVRANGFLPQLEYNHDIKLENIEKNLQIFIFGLIKKVVIADRLAVCVDAVFAVPDAYDAASIVCAIIAYSMQIYCDFSGYSDMAIAVAGFFGYDLCENFNMPYISKNLTEFWKRWHISLSVWLKDYLYISLGGNRKGKIRTYINLMITMVLGGLWHGASWTFVLWGLMHGAALIVHKIFLAWKKSHHLSCRDRKSVLHIVLNIVSVLMTYCYVCVGWVFFRAESVSQAFDILKRIISGADGIHYIYSYTIIYGILIAACHLYGIWKNGGQGEYPILKLEKFWSKVILCVVVGLVMVFSYQGDNAFVYFQF